MYTRDRCLCVCDMHVHVNDISKLYVADKFQLTNMKSFIKANTKSTHDEI